MPSRLKTLPTEVIELIVRLLPLKDIRSLRLTCKALADKSSESHFKTFFHTQHVDVTPVALRTFIEDVQAGGFRSCVRRLCLVGVADNKATRPDPYQFDPRDEEVPCLLTQTFDELSKYHRPDDTQLSLSLGLRIVHNGVSRRLTRAAADLAKSKNAWQCVVETFHRSLRALADSKLHVKGLDIFNGPNMENCSLPSEQLNIVNWGDPGLVESLSSVTCLSVNISNRVFPHLGGRDGPDGGLRRRTLGGGRPPGLLAHAQEDGNFSGLAKLFPAYPRLEELDLRFRGIPDHRGPHVRFLLRWKILHHVAQLQTLPALKRLSIRGFTANSPDLVSILERTRPRELSLGPLWLETGTYHPIFDYCSSARANMSRASFENLVQMSLRDGGVVHFISQCPRLPVTRNPSPTSGFQAQFCSEFAEFENPGLGPKISCHLDRSGFIGMPKYGGCPPSRRQDHLNNFF
ncbi:hypothetical protein ACJ41O_009232 [Fusarium nematophilum]